MQWLWSNEDQSPVALMELVRQSILNRVEGYDVELNKSFFPQGPASFELSQRISSVEPAVSLEAPIIVLSVGIEE